MRHMESSSVDPRSPGTRHPRPSAGWYKPFFEPDGGYRPPLTDPDAGWAKPDGGWNKPNAGWRLP